MSAHTPGPWTIRHADGRTYVIAADGKEVAVAYRGTGPLIAAAPTLAEALRALLDVSDVEGVPLEQRAIARAALAEAGL
jgi:hypothetical protein